MEPFHFLLVLSLLLADYMCDEHAQEDERIHQEESVDPYDSDPED